MRRRHQEGAVGWHSDQHCCLTHVCKGSPWEHRLPPTGINVIIGVRLIVDSKMHIGVTVRVNDCLSLCVSPATGWRWVQGVSCLSGKGSRNPRCLQHPTYLHKSHHSKFRCWDISFLSNSVQQQSSHTHFHLSLCQIYIRFPLFNSSFDGGFILDLVPH